MKVRNTKTNQIGKVDYQNLNPMAGIPGYYVKFVDGRTEFWTLGVCEEVEESIVSDTRRTERAGPPAAPDPPILTLPVTKGGPPEHSNKDSKEKKV